MKVRIARSIRMPTLYSYFISGFGEDILDHFKSNRPFSFYHRKDKEYEVTKHVYDEVASSSDIIVDERVEFPTFTRASKNKYGYQEDAVSFARLVDNILINFPQGTGKSRTVMMIVDDKKFKKTLVVCGQSNLQEEWIRDARKHNFADKLNFRIIGDSPEATSAKKARWIMENKEVSGVDVINIEALRNTAIVTALNVVGYDCLVVDEVQSAKGWRAQQTEGLHNLREVEGQVRLALSGTPVLNGPLEFFSVLKFLRQLKDTARTTYEQYYGEWAQDWWGHYVCKAYRNLDDLQQLLIPVIAYVDKAELKLPEKTRIKVSLTQPKSKELLQLEKIYRMSAARLKAAGYTSKPQVRARIQVLTSTAECKVNYIVDNFPNRRLLVFSQYTEVLKAVQRQFESKGKKVLVYTGEMTMEQRLEVLDKWYSGGYDILLLSLMAARYGLNLVEATDVFFLEPPTSLAVLEQGEDRAHRIGQQNEVRSYLLCWGKGDEERLESIINKQGAIDEVFNFTK